MWILEQRGCVGGIECIKAVMVLGREENLNRYLSMGE